MPTITNNNPDYDCIKIPLRENGEWIRYANLPRVIAAAVASGTSLEMFFCEATGDFIIFGENEGELENWVSKHLSDICLESKLLTDNRSIVKEHLWTLLYRVVAEAKIRSSYIQ